MSYQATVFNIMIASPGDLKAERKVCEEVISMWNQNHSRETNAILLPSMWEYTEPMSGDHPQNIVNRENLASADFLIALFWCRIGSPTEHFESGTIEEIELAMQSNKNVMLYFSQRHVPIDSDQSQLDKVKEFQKKYQKKALYKTFKSRSDFKTQLTNHLSKAMTKILSDQKKQTQSKPIDQTPSPSKKTESKPSENDDLIVQVNKSISLSQQASKLLSLAANGNGKISFRQAGLYYRITANGIEVTKNCKTPIEFVYWKSVFMELVNKNLIEQNRKTSYEVTKLGYEVANVRR